MLHMLAKYDCVALKREAEDRWRCSHRTSCQQRGVRGVFICQQEFLLSWLSCSVIIKYSIVLSPI